MEIVIHELTRDNLPQIGECNGNFIVDAKLMLAATNAVIEFSIVSITPYQKQYPAESIDYEAYIDNPGQTIFLGQVNGEIAGQIRLRRNWNHYAYIEDIVVDIKFRRRGLAKELIRRTIQWAQDKKLAGVMVETQNNNVAACLLYQQCGFELGGFDNRLYQGQNPDTEEIALYWYLGFERGK